MKLLQRICSVGLLLCIGMVFSTMQAQSYAQLWHQMEQAREKGLPKTMIQVADRIIRKAELEQNAPQLLKATVWGEYVQSRLTPDSIYAGIRHLEAWAARETHPVHRAILYSILAERYQDEMWKSGRTGQERTELDVEEAPADLREWSRNLFVDKVDACLQASLKEEKALLEVSAKEYQPFMILGDGSQFYQHDLYHLLASRALKTYEQIENYLPDTLLSQRVLGLRRHMAEVYAARPGAEPAALLTALHWIQLERREAVRLAPYQEYQAVQKAAGERYLQRLDSLIARYGTQEVCAEAYICKASWLKNVSNGSLLDCLHVCAEGLKRYPRYPRIAELKNIREEVEQPLLSGRLPGPAYPGDTLKLAVEHRNLSGFTWNLYHTSLTKIPNLDGPITAAYLQKQGRKIGSSHVELVPTPKAGRSQSEWRYLRSDTLVRVPVPDEIGVYILQLVPDHRKSPMDAKFFVQSRLRPLTLKVNKKQTEVLVVDAQSGHPLEGVEIKGYDRSYEYSKEKVLQTLVTNAEGKAVFTEEGIQSYTVRQGNDAALPRQSLNVRVRYGREEDGQGTKHLTLLTDRSIYRPGQTVYVKGVAYRQQGWEAEVLKQADYELVLQDVNRQEIASRKLRTNDFGSFTAEFVLPSSCLNGMFTLCTRDRRSVVRMQVEEYKRPTFEIQFTPLSEGYCLGEEVVLKGTVKAFNGRSVQHLPLAYTLEYNSWNRRHVSSVETLQHDTVLLDVQGHFEIPVKLRREGVNHLDNMEYILRAVVTDEAGETQTADYRFRAMDQRYLISVGLPSVLCKEDSLRARVHVSNAALVPQSVTGTAALYRKADWKQLQTDSRTTVVKPVWKGTFQANEQTDFSAWSQLPSGEYCLQLTVRDSLGREQTYPAPAGSVNAHVREAISFLLYSKQDTRLPAFRHLFYQAEEETFDARQPAVWYLGTSHRDVHLMMDVFKGHDRLSSRSFQLTDTLMRMELPYQEAYGEGVSVLFTFVKRGQVYSTWQILKKKQPQTTLDMKWTVFRDRLRPGQPEEWQLTVKRPDGLPADAEMLALLYDASLDQFKPHRQSLLVDRSPSFYAHRWATSNEQWMYFRFHFPYGSYSVPRWKYDSFFVPFGMVDELIIVENDALDRPVMVGAARPLYKSAVQTSDERGTAVEVKYVPVAVEEEEPEEQANSDDVVLFEEEVVSIGAQEVLEEPLMAIRQNFAETAFFYPQLRTNAQGDIVLSFTMPESLTRWNFRGYAHTQDMMTGQLEASVVTAKEFMVQPNLPRFLRVGDHTQLSATVTNLTEKAVKGTVRLTLFDPMTGQVVLTRKQKFSADAGRNAAATFPVEMDGRYSLLGVRLMAEGGDFSDGEQQLLPVLTDRIFLTETLPITVRGGEQKDCSLDKLFNGQSSSVTGRRLTVEFTGNPAWYAIQALPSLSVPASQSATDYATALYANALAGYLASSQLRIQAVITQWRQSGGTEETFRSQLEKNQELKQILLNESPWVLEAETEAEQRARIATLFDLNQLKDRRYAALTRLKELQLPEGAWSWYKGMGPSPLMTYCITELLVRLPLLTDQPLEGDAKLLLQKAFGYLHQQTLKEYQEVKKAERQGAKFTEPSFTALQYLYLLALSGETVPKANQKVQAYWLDKVAGLLEDGSVTQKAQATVILWKAGRKKQAQDFAASLREYLILEEESGAHFAFLDEAYRWGMMPVPVHVAAMEALRLVGTEEALLEEMKIWLLKQKQTTAWNSPVATADAVYALLMGGRNPLESAGEVRITLGNHTLSTTDASATWAGLNYVKETFTEGHAEVTAPRISVHNTGEGMAWGAVYAQYLAPMEEVQSQGGALSVQKQLFVERMDATGHKTLQPVGEGAELRVGDVVVSRLTVSLDRAMDFVQLKDARGACFEPMTAHSGYRWLSGCGAYVEVEDAATNFFFDHLGKGVYVLENRCRLARRGTYQAGIATLQSAYAPEFAAHSAGMTVTIP